MIEKILPSWVVTAEEFGDVPDATLFPEEEELIANAVAVRRGEFVTGRHCARRALARLGVSPGPIPRGERGAPLWPPGTIGSITHCAGYRAAAVAAERDAATLGIDAEPHGPLPSGVLEAIARPEEIVALRLLQNAEPGVCWDRILFSAKESVYKAWFPVTGRWLEFSEASVDIGTSGRFTARLLVTDARMGTDLLAGRWLVADGLLATAIARARQDVDPDGRRRPPQSGAGPLT
ncbi:4'-phosphopantetheinyl transferase superfamily protein [Planotetraspora sp. A-T 1434]|uniref:4'-phosphopantetheinyl transferase family protein n=1 Tax=Planotetraspora sp. A-T 1434 TaxID=2979219 RepID=UPI0021BFE2AF|nr:4'-phosphopantetheinyl transferase superfamily protein [Planotetraspora sp. A-T 1434]MCT9930189.1 4'-phosphopantetheinyl transferase superfamily protein [Planotetraspora sp. A-T 1434]